MVRPADVVVDQTPLNGSRVDVPARIGWTLRVARMLGGFSLSDFAPRLRERGALISAPALSRFETSGTRDGRLIDAYEDALGLESGRLRAPIDVLCRTFRYAPDDRSPGLREPATLARFDAAIGPVLDGAPTGSQWLAFAREHDDRTVGLPTELMRPLIAQLAGELGRAVGTAYVTRYEALARLRCGAYGGVVEEVARCAVEDPDTQVLLDLMCAVAERPTPDLLAWVSSLLCSDSMLRLRGAALAIENMGSIGRGLDQDDWVRMIPDFLKAAEGACDDPNRSQELGRLYRSLPSGVRHEIRGQLPCSLGQVRSPVSWTASRRNAHYEYAADLARRVCAAAGLADQPMLTRLLFEVIYDFRSVRSVTSSFLLAGSPLVTVLQVLLLEAAMNTPDATTQIGVEGAISTLQASWPLPDVMPWLSTRQPSTVRSALVVAGHAGLALPDDLVMLYLSDPRISARALYYAGMAQHPVLGVVAGDPHQPQPLRVGARWWLGQGGRVTA